MDMASTAASCALALTILNSGFLLIDSLMIARDLGDLGRIGGASSRLRLLLWTAETRRPAQAYAPASVETLLLVSIGLHLLHCLGVVRRRAVLCALCARATFHLV